MYTYYKLLHTHLTYSIVYFVGHNNERFSFTVERFLLQTKFIHIPSPFITCSISTIQQINITTIHPPPPPVYPDTVGDCRFGTSVFCLR